MVFAKTLWIQSGMQERQKGRAMNDSEKNLEMISDYATGQKLPNVGAEANRQDVERFLVEDRGYRKTDLSVNHPIAFSVQDEPYQSRLDILVFVNNLPFMVVKCAAGALGTRDREAVSAARIVLDAVVPYALISDGKEGIFLDGETGKILHQELSGVPTRVEAEAFLQDYTPITVSNKKREKDKLIFRSYDSMNVNRV